jgi:monodehydroascorbate reductase (NADH)
MGLAHPGSSSAPEDVLGRATHYRVVVLGFGVSAGYFADELSKRISLRHQVAFVGAEPVEAYERPALSKGYLFPPGGTRAPVRLPAFNVRPGGAAQTKEWYAKQGYRTYLGRTVTKVDLRARRCTIRAVDNGSEQLLGFDRLVVATGAEPRTIASPGAELDGVMYLRCEADARQILDRVQRVTGRSAAVSAAEGGGAGALPPPRGRVVVVGGGYLGVELITCLAGWGVEEVAVVILSDILLSKMAWPRVAREKINTAILQRAPNIKLYKNCSVEKFLPAAGEPGKLGAVVIDDGGDGIRMDSFVALTCELCIVCIGARAGALPRALAADGDLRCRKDGSLVTDRTLRTSHASRKVWAVGEATLLECGVAGARSMGVFAARSVAASLRLRGREPPDALAEITELEHHYSRFFEYTDHPIVWQSYGSFGVVSGKREAAGFGLGNHFDKGFGYFWFDPRSRKVVSSFCASDGKSKLLETVAKAAMEAWDIDVAMKTVYVFVK